MQRSQQNTPRYLTDYQIERKVQMKELRQDLFDCLLQERTNYADAQSCAKMQQTGLMEAESMIKQQQADENEATSHHGCRCSKIGCLKLYCECFANGRKCGGNCECSCCRNKTGNQSEIYHAKMLANYRHPGHFKGVPALTPTRKCTCKKSMCQKRYCECYSAGMKCTQFCECKDCQNGHPHSHDQNDQALHFVEHQLNMMEIQVPA